MHLTNKAQPNPQNFIIKKLSTQQIHLINQIYWNSININSNLFPSDANSHECHISNEPIPQNHDGHCNDRQAYSIQAHILYGRKLLHQTSHVGRTSIRLTRIILRHQKQLVRILSDRHILDPTYGLRDMLHVEPSRKEEYEHDHRPKRDGRSLIHDCSPNGEP